MSNRVHPVSWSIRRFPQKGALPVTLILWAAVFVVVEGSTVAMGGPFGLDPWLAESVWISAVYPMMLAIGFAAGLSYAFYLRLHVAHGQTREGFMSQAAVYLVVSSAALAVLTALGFVLEEAVYGARGWRDYYPMEEQYVINSAGDFPVVCARLWLELGTLMVAGLLVAAGYRSFRMLGVLLTIPLAVAMFALTSNAVGSAYIFSPSYEVQDILLWPALASILLTLGAIWSLTRRAQI
jgi:hypothetical protein